MLNQLYEEEVDLGALETEESAAISDELHARSTLIVVQQIEAEKKALEDTKRAVVASYDARLSALEERAKFLRARLLDYVTDHGKVSFPDVGTAYTTKTATKVVLSDREEVVETYGRVFEKPVFDETAFRRHAAEEYERTGEILKGCDVVPPSVTLAIRKA